MEPHTVRVGYELHLFHRKLVDHPPVVLTMPCHLFGSLKHHVGGCQFHSNEEVAMAVCVNLFCLYRTFPDVPKTCSMLMSTFQSNSALAMEVGISSEASVHMYASPHPE
jgi:hypothetical protein